MTWKPQRRTWSWMQWAEAGAEVETGDMIMGTSGHINQTRVQRQRSGLELQGQKGRGGQVKREDLGQRQTDRDIAGRNGQKGQAALATS